MKHKKTLTFNSNNLLFELGLLQLEKGPADMKVSGRLKDYDVAAVYIGHKRDPNHTGFAISTQKAFKIKFRFRLFNIIKSLEYPILL